MNGWISVADKLPEDNQEVLVLYLCDGYLYLDVGVRQMYDSGPIWYMNSPSYSENGAQVMFWQPAPEYDTGKMP